MFQNRFAAGRMLAAKLTAYANRQDVLVLALPRGGVPVAFAVAQALHAPLDIWLVRKLGVPGQEELAMGAIASGNVRVLNDMVVQSLHIPDQVIAAVTAAEQRELERRERIYRGNRPLPHVRGRTVILIDDGIATGATMRAAIAALRQLEPARIVVAVPVIPAATVDVLRAEADELIYVAAPERFFGVGFWYEDFSQATDDEIRDLLQRAWRDQDAN
jgi:putative phosphoribosyl transferase